MDNLNTNDRGYLSPTPSKIFSYEFCLIDKNNDSLIADLIFEFSHRLNSRHSQLKQYDALCPELLEHRDSLLNIHSYALSTLPSLSPSSSSPIITINVSGCRFQTLLSTLEIYPETLLGNAEKRQIYWNDENKEYFFDRHRACFESILYFYQSKGRLRRPDFAPLDTFLEEINFFQLGTEALRQVHQIENISIIEQHPLPRILWRRYLWFYLEFPQHTCVARFIHLISMFFTILSCVALAIETLPEYTHRAENICREQANLSFNSTIVPRCSALFTSPFFIIQSICVAYFSIEFILRLISTPSYCRFICSLFNWIDLSAIVPYFVFLILRLADQYNDLNTNAILGLRLLRVLRFIRIFKIYLVFKKLKPLRVLTSTIRESLLDFSVMIVILTLIAFLFGAAIYFAEQDMNGDVFDSIPKATYWGIVTITGVGYGDMYPVTVIGRILTCLSALVGAGMMGMLVSVLVDRYQRVYQRKMYVPEHDLPSIDLNTNPEDNKETQSKISRRTNSFLSFISKRFPVMYQRMIIKQTSASMNKCCKIQFIVSFNGEEIDDQETETMITTIKTRINETISKTSANMDLKLIYNTNDKLWTTNLNQ